MNVNEIFPPTEQELEAMIFTLTKMLEDKRYRRRQWQELAEELKDKEKQLQQLKEQHNETTKTIHQQVYDE